MFGLQVAVLSLLWNLNLSMEEYYVINSSNTIRNHSCIVNDEVFRPCFILDEMADSLHFIPHNVSNISIFFLSEYYLVHGNISFLFESLTTVHLSPWVNTSKVILECTDGLSMNLTDVDIIRIESFSFQDCGKYKHVISINKEARIVQVNNAEFTRSEYGFITLNKVQKLDLTNCIFYANMEGFCVSIKLLISVIEIVNSSFINNAGGFIVSHSNAYVSVQNCKFINNSINGAIVIKSGYYAELEINSSKFINNSASTGGSLKLKHVTQVSIFHSNFEGNLADNDGGAIAIELGHFLICSATLFIDNCHFIDNKARGSGGGIFSQTFTTCKVQFNLSETVFIHNSAKEGGALSISHEKNSLTTPRKQQHASVFINDSTFIKSHGTIGGALDLYGVNNLRLSNSNFSDNVAKSTKNSTTKCESSHQYNGAGGAIAIWPLSYLSVFITHCNFDGNTGTIGGAIYGNILSARSDIRSIINIDRSNFTTNTALNCGGALSLHSIKSTCITFYRSNFFSNTAKIGGALNLHNATSSAIHCLFQENGANTGGAIYCGTYTTLNVTNVIFQNNSASYDGGGIAIVLSFLIITGGFNNFTNNNAVGKGGVIYSDDKREDCHTDICPVLWKQDTIIRSSNNSALFGSMLYGGMIDRCYVGNTTGLSTKNILFSKKTDTNPPAIASDVTKFCFYRNNVVSYCDTREMNETLFPGQSMILNIACLDQTQKALSCDIKSEYYGTTKIKLGEGESSRTINGYDNITFHAFSREQKIAKLIIIADQACDQSKWSELKVNIIIRDNCPLGFEKDTDRCQCDHRLKGMLPSIECDINNNLVTISEKAWFGYGEKYLRIYKDCLINYDCSLKDKTLHPNDPDSWCLGNHGGVLCGRCLANYSVVLGNWKCKDCSNLSRYNFIWLTVVMALAGVVLVVFLLLVKMTVSSGTINGLIFYANILSFSGLLDYHACSIDPFLRVFLSWINLDFGIEACFYSGMDVYQKTWLQFIFPFYIWFLVGVIILFCHYSSTVMKLMGMRNIELLATLFLLSYAKLLKTIVTSLSFTNISIASAYNVTDSLISQRVWVYDGNINYFSKKHLPILIVSLSFLLILFLPYTLLLLFGQCLRSLPTINGKQWIQGTAFTSIMDAYHAPYTSHHRYWTGLGLLVRCFLLTVFSTSYSIQKNLFWITFVVVFMIIIRQLFKVYQKKFPNYLELFYFSNLGLLCTALQYRYNACYVLTISTAFSFVIFVCTLVYHVNLQIREHVGIYDKIKKRIFHLSLNNSKTPNTVTDKEAREIGTPECPSTTYVELRETLLEN